MPAKGAGTIPQHRNSSSVGRVLVIGGGICGLSVAWRLAQAGIAVGVVDAGEAGRGATWAAGGMLAAALEAEPGEEAMVGLARWSQDLWTGRHAAAASSAGVGYRRGKVHLRSGATNGACAACATCGASPAGRMVRAGALRERKPASARRAGRHRQPGDTRSIVRCAGAAGPHWPRQACRSRAGALRSADGGGWRVPSARPGQADHVVLAAGASRAGSPAAGNQYAGKGGRDPADGPSAAPPRRLGAGMPRAAGRRPTLCRRHGRDRG
jgi:glycine oxidase